MTAAAAFPFLSEVFISSAMMSFYIYIPLNFLLLYTFVAPSSPQSSGGYADFIYRLADTGSSKTSKNDNRYNNNDNINFNSGRRKVDIYLNSLRNDWEEDGESSSPIFSSFSTISRPSRQQTRGEVSNSTIVEFDDVRTNLVKMFKTFFSLCHRNLFCLTKHLQIFRFFSSPFSSSASSVPSSFPFFFLMAAAVENISVSSSESFVSSESPQIKFSSSPPSYPTFSTNIKRPNRIIMAYPLEGCIDTSSNSHRQRPMLQGKDMRESTIRLLSFKVAEFLHVKGNKETEVSHDFSSSFSNVDEPMVLGQTVSSLPTTPRFVDLETLYLSALQMEVTTVPVGLSDLDLVGLADSLPCVENVYQDSYKYSGQVLYDEDDTIQQNQNVEEYLSVASGNTHKVSDSESEEKTMEKHSEILEDLEIEGSKIMAANGDAIIRSHEMGRVSHEELIPNDSLFSSQWSLHDSQRWSINAESAWYFWNGMKNPMVVAVIDSGCDLSHPELVSKLWKNPNEICGDNIDNDNNGYVDDCNGFDFVNNDNVVDARRSGHGTGAAGIIGAESNNALGITGVCWGCTIMCLKFIGEGKGRISDQVKAIDYAVKMGAWISNNSYGGYGFAELEFRAIERAQLAGHLFVCSVGNHNFDTDLPINNHTPSVYSLNNILAVAAMLPNGRKTSFSNFGAQSVDVFAPGAAIRTIQRRGGYAMVSGTSFAAPIVTGSAALLWTAFPNLSYLQIKTALMDGCIKTDNLKSEKIIELLV